jgi:hypothetical protein
VLGADVVVVEKSRFFLGQNDDPASPIGKAFEHDEGSPIAGHRRRQAVGQFGLERAGVGRRRVDRRREVPEPKALPGWGALRRRRRPGDHPVEVGLGEGAGQSGRSGSACGGPVGDVGAAGGGAVQPAGEQVGQLIAPGVVLVGVSPHRAQLAQLGGPIPGAPPVGAVLGTVVGPQPGGHLVSGCGTVGQCVDQRSDLAPGLIIACSDRCRGLLPRAGRQIAVDADRSEQVGDRGEEGEPGVGRCRHVLPAAHPLGAQPAPDADDDQLRVDIGGRWGLLVGGRRGCRRARWRLRRRRPHTHPGSGRASRRYQIAKATEQQHSDNDGDQGPDQPGARVADQVDRPGLTVDAQPVEQPGTRCADHKPVVGLGRSKGLGEVRGCRDGWLVVAGRVGLGRAEHPGDRIGVDPGPGRRVDRRVGNHHVAGLGPARARFRSDGGEHPGGRAGRRSAARTVSARLCRS